jgi:Zn-dependent peptidase ImmA (M78 family)
VVNVNNKSVERIRFTIIHELAHLLLDLTPVAKEKKQEEIYCHLFSTCFLIPTEQLNKLIGNGKRGYINIKELESIKEYYGISIRAILHRLKDLEVITDVYYQKWMVWLTKKYGAKNEPGKYQGEEKSKGLEQMVGRALAEGIISISKAAALCNTTINHLRKDFISVI